MCHYWDPWWSRRARVAFEGGDLGGAKPRGLLELLLLARGKSVSKDALADALWGMNPPNNVAGTIEQYVSLLRRRLFDEAALSKRAIVTEPQAYRVDIDEVGVDLDRFDSMILRAEHADVVDAPRVAQRRGRAGPR